MEKYLIFKKTSEVNRKYAYYIQRNSVSTSEDIGDAIEFDNKDLALAMVKYLSKRDKEQYYVLSVVTTIEVVENGDE